MLKKIQYHTTEERESIIQENQHLFLVEDQELFEGKFLVFGEQPNIVYKNIPLAEYENLKNRVEQSEEALNIFLLGGIQ